MSFISSDITYGDSSLPNMKYKLTCPYQPITSYPSLTAIIPTEIVVPTPHGQVVHDSCTPACHANFQQEHIRTGLVAQWQSV
jgi:hypothetical protein